MNEFSRLAIEETPSMTRVTGSSGRVLALYSASADQGGANESPQQGSAKSPPQNNDDSSVPVGQWKGSQSVELAPGRYTAQAVAVAAGTQQSAFGRAYLALENPRAASPSGVPQAASARANSSSP